MVKYLHSMIRVTDPEATVAFFKLVGLEEVRRFDNEEGRLEPAEPWVSMPNVGSW